MTIDSGMISCGKRGGPTFLETVRVDPLTRECPRGLVPCNYNSPADETVCVKEYEWEFECPIVDILLVHEDNIFQLESEFKITEKGYPNKDEKKTFIAFSKTLTRENESYAPIISSAINTGLPCYGPDKDRLIVSAV